MGRNIHDIYDVILKIIISVYGTVFLNYIGIDEEIMEVLNIEFTTLEGSKHYLDFLCLLKNGNLCNIEFQYPKAKTDDLDRFFNYNIIAQVRHEKVTDTAIFNFNSRKDEAKPRRIGKTKCFCPYHFYWGDFDCEEYCKNINIKAESNKQLSSFDEITLMLMPMHPKFKGDFKILKKISEIIGNKELFDETRYEFIQAVIELEIENFLSKDDQKEILGGIKMTPRAQSVVTQAIHEVNQKVLAETEREGIEKGIEKGKSEAMEEVARTFRNKVDIDELSRVTGLSVEEIQNL